MVGGCKHNKIKSHTRWVGDPQTRKHNTKEALPLLWRLSQASQPGEATKGLGIPRQSDSEGQWDLITGLPQDWGEKRDSSLGGYTQNLALTKTQRKGAVTARETEPKLPASVGGSPAEAGLSGSSPQRQEHWQQQSWKVPLGISPLGGCH